MGEVNDSSRPEFWDVRYASGKMPWDFHAAPARLLSFLEGRPSGRALIPGCGIGYEVRPLIEAGWNVTAIDFSWAAVEQARNFLGELGRRVQQADFFQFGCAESFDLIYERTFLCALPPNLWPAYAERMAWLLRTGGLLAGFFLYGEEPEPPPYPLTEEQARELFGKSFTLRRSLPVADSLPLYLGKERWEEWEKIR